MRVLLLFLCTGCAGQLKDTAELFPTDTSEPDAPEAQRAVFVLDVAEQETDWNDLAFLATIPASKRLTGGFPTVLAVDAEDGISATTEDLLRRLQPELALTVNTALEVPHSAAQEALTAADPTVYGLLLAQRYWQQADTAVLVSAEDYPAAVQASSLAALLDAPLLFTDTLEETDLAELSAETLLHVSLDGGSEPSFEGEVLLDSVDTVLAWLSSNGHAIDYVAVTNPEDRASGRSQKSSLFASVYAAYRGGITVPVDLEMPTEVVLDGAHHPVVDVLSAHYDTLGSAPEYLAIVGAHDSLPQTRKPSIFDNPVAEHPVSDLPYGELDEDPFLDIAIGRIVGDRVFELSNLAARTVNYDRLKDGVWEQNFLESGLWGFDELRENMLNVGYQPPEHLSQLEINARESLEVAAVLHKDHSYCQVLGHAFDINSSTRLAPSVVMSRGCSVGGIDLLPASQRSIVEHMLGMGAVAFVGGSRNSIAHNTVIEVSLWNQLLEGRPLGQAFRHGINDGMVHWLAENNSAAFRYSLDIEMFYGDPALGITVPAEPSTAPAQQIWDGQQLTVRAPEQWTQVHYHPEQLAEWNYEGDLFMYTGPGSSPKTYWSGSYDTEEMYFGVQLRLDHAPSTLTPLAEVAPPLGLDGEFYIDNHDDGSLTALWRVRLLDFDPLTGEVLDQAERFEFLLE